MNQLNALSKCVEYYEAEYQIKKTGSNQWWALHGG